MVPTAGPHQYFVIGDIRGKSGYHLGDEAMFEGALSYVARILPGYEPVVLSWNPEEVADLYRVRAVRRYASSKKAKWILVHLYNLFISATYRITGRWLHVSVFRSTEAIRSMAQSAFVLHTGSGSWHNWGRTWYLLDIWIYLWCASLLRVPVLIVSQSLGPFETNSLRKWATTLLAKWTLARDNVRLITVRDRLWSYEFVSSIRSRGITGYALDDSVWINPASDQQVSEFLLACGLGDASPFMIVSLTPASSGVAGAHVASALDAFLEKHAELHALFVPHVWPRADISVHDSVISRMKHKQRAVAARSFCDAGLLRGLTRRARLVLSARYHGVVFACLERVPAVAYAVNPVRHRKMCGVIDMLGVSHVIVHTSAKDSTDELLPALERAMQLLAPAGDSSDSGASVSMSAACSNELFVRRALRQLCP